MVGYVSQCSSQDFFKVALRNYSESWFARVPCYISMFLYQGRMVFYFVYHVEQYVEKYYAEK